MALRQSQGLAAALSDAGVDVELSVFDGLWHDFHLHAGVMGAADDAIDEIAAFLERG